MAITRRQFLKRSGLATAGMTLGPGLFANPFVRRALADTIGDRYFVVIFLDGGNDGLNTVPIYNNGSGTLRDDYNLARIAGPGGLRLTPDDLDGTTFGNGGTLLSTLNPLDPSLGKDPNTGAKLALHPGFRGFPDTQFPALPQAPGKDGFFHLDLIGKVAVIQGCGYPQYSLSHDEARNVWKTGDPAALYGGPGYGGSGWIGRHLADLSSGYLASDIPGICIQDSIAGELKQTKTSILALQRLDRFGFPYDSDNSDDDTAKRTAFLDLHGQASASAQATIKYLGDGGSVTLKSSESYPAAGVDYDIDRGTTFGQEYDDLGRSLGRDLREVAKIIWGVSHNIINPDNSARFFQVSNGGYDTHSDQGAADPNGQHFSLHAEVSAAINIFYRDLKDMGLENKVCVLVWSEFSRRIHQNDNGTDHGSQGPMFVIGGAVNGGVYGVHPNIADSAQDGEGNTIYQSTPDIYGFKSTDFRDVYGTVLKHWLNMPSGIIVPNVLQTDSGSAPDYWTTPNFDMGFI